VRAGRSYDESQAAGRARQTTDPGVIPVPKCSGLLMRLWYPDSLILRTGHEHLQTHESLPLEESFLSTVILAVLIALPII